MQFFPDIILSWNDNDDQNNIIITKNPFVWENTLVSMVYGALSLIVFILSSILTRKYPLDDYFLRKAALYCKTMLVMTIIGSLFQITIYTLIYHAGVDFGLKDKDNPEEGFNYYFVLVVSIDRFLAARAKYILIFFVVLSAACGALTLVLAIRQAVGQDLEAQVELKYRKNAKKIEKQRKASEKKAKKE